MNRRIIFLILISVNTVFAQTSSNSINSSAIDSIFQSYNNPGEPGMAIGIVKEGEIVYRSSRGIADLTNNLPITDSTAFNIASVSKQFTAFLALIAEKEGKFKLSDDIRWYLPELKNLPFKITIEQLANHSHGLPNYSDLIEMIGFGLSSPISNKQAVETLLNVRQINFKAGTKYQYGNSGFILLAEILKRVYEKPFPNLMEEKVFQPLQMNRTAVIDNPNTIVNNKAIAYKKNSNYYIEHTNRQMENGSSNIYTTLNDMLKWAINFQNPTVGFENQISQLSKETISITKTGDLNYGLGLYTETYRGLKIIFHGGGTAGYRAYILHVPEHNFSIITLGNQESFDALLIIYDILELYFKAYFKRPAPEKTPYTKKELKAYTGTYRYQPGQYWTFKVDGENLYFEGVEQPLSVVGNSKFKFFLPLSFITFHSNSMEFRISDMNYYCEKIDFNPPVFSKEELEAYVGIYKNKEFNVFYELLMIEDNLVAKHLTNGEIVLNPLTKNTFFATYPLGELSFQLNQDGLVNGFVLSGQNFSNTKFIKVN
ncbi:serine hydrolase domain-containing protein [Flavobacteriaceae bacterium M23B6Z8]